jgi:hypothetical protein
MINGITGAMITGRNPVNKEITLGKIHKDKAVFLPNKTTDTKRIKLTKGPVII